MKIFDIVSTVLNVHQTLEIKSKTASTNSFALTDKKR